MYDHFQKTRQLARGEGKIEFSVDIRCVGTSGKTARSARPKVDLLPHSKGLSTAEGGRGHVTTYMYCVTIKIQTLGPDIL